MISDGWMDRKIGEKTMTMIFNLIYTLAGLVLFIIGLLCYTQQEIPIHIGAITAIVGLVVFIVGAIRMNEDN